MLATTPRRVLVSILALLVVTAALLAAFNVQQDRAQAREIAAAEARAELAMDTAERRRGFAGPAREAARDAASARLLLGELLTGSERGASEVAAEIEQRTQQLREDADGLELAADEAEPVRPDILDAELVGRIDAHLSQLRTDAPLVAAQVRETADDVDALAEATHAIRAALEAYTDTELSGSDEPDVVADAWRDERDRLGDIRATLEDADEHAELAPVLTALTDVVDDLDALAAGAIEDLEAEDLDAYEQRLEEGVGNRARERFSADVTAAMEEALDRSVAQLEDVESRALGLVTLTQDLRSVTPGRP